MDCCFLGCSWVFTAQNSIYLHIAIELVEGGTPLVCLAIEESLPYRIETNFYTNFACSISLLAIYSLWCEKLGCRYEDAFNRFIDEINSVAAYDWWEGSVHSILSIFAYPCAWSWKQWRRRNKIHRLQEFVKSEYDHSCLRSCRSRALYKGMKVWLIYHNTLSIPISIIEVSVALAFLLIMAMR